MGQSNNSFPLFFTLERMDNGYVLTSKVEAEGLTQESTYRKEVVVNEKIDARIGHLLCLDALVKEHPVVFHVEAVGENTYKIEDMPDRENLMVAKLSFAHFNARKYPADSVIVLHIEDTNMIEVYGRDAERIADTNGVSLMRIGGIPLLRFPNNKEGMRTMATLVKNSSLVRVTESQIMDWYHSHDVPQEKQPTPPAPGSRQSNNNSSSNTQKK